MARWDPCLPLIAECVWQLHQLHAARGCFDEQAIPAWLEANHGADLDRTCAVHGIARSPQMLAAPQLGRFLDRLGQQRCPAFEWRISARTTNALEDWMRDHCPERLSRLTGANWPRCTDPTGMLAHLGSIPPSRLGSPTHRKLRLFACAAVRAAPERLTGPRCLRAVRIAERVADGLAGEEELAAARQEAMLAWQLAHDPTAGDSRPEENLAVVWAAYNAALADPALAARDAADAMRRVGQAFAQDQCHLLRDIFGPVPSRPATLDPVWLASNDAAVAHVAGSLYESRNFADLPILADALEDAGCSEASLLDHLRTPGRHVPGCHVLDLLTGRG
jgi:hypothetical protein